MNWIENSGIDFSDGDNARKELVERYMSKENCSETLREIILGGKGSIAARHIWELPIGFSWETRPG